MNRIAIKDLATVQALRTDEMAAVTGGLISSHLFKKFVRVHRFLPPWVPVLLNPQPLPPRLRGRLLG